MMFRSVQADDESGSDWDDYTPTTKAPAVIHTLEPPASHYVTTTHSPQRTHPSPPHISHTSTHYTLTPHPPSDVKPHNLTSVSRREDPPLLRAPRTLPPIETTTPPPLTPAAVNPVYSETVEVNHEELTNVDIPHTKSGVLEFASVDDQSAQLLVPTQEPPPYSYMGGLAERSEIMSKRCTEEVFSCLRIVTDFVITFILGLLYYLLYHVTRKLCCGALHIVSDSLTKPLFGLCFNDLLWPLSACLYQLSKAFVLILTPIVNLVGDLLVHVTNMLRACRLVELQFSNQSHKPMTV